MKASNLNETYGRKIINENYIEANIVSLISVYGKKQKYLGMGFEEIVKGLERNRGVKSINSEIRKILENSKLVEKVNMEGNEIYKLTF